MENELKTVFRHTPNRSDDCIYCQGKRCIEMYNDYNKPLAYSNLLDNNVNMLNMRVKYATCKVCGRTFNIFWDHTQTPIPLYITSLTELFLKINFKQQ